MLQETEYVCSFGASVVVYFATKFHQEFAWQAKAGSFHQRDEAADLLTVVAMQMINGYPKNVTMLIVRMFFDPTQWIVARKSLSHEKNYSADIVTMDFISVTMLNCLFSSQFIHVDLLLKIANFFLS